MKYLYICVISLMLLSFGFATTQLFYAGMETGDTSEFTGTHTNAVGASVANSSTYYFNGIRSLLTTTAGNLNSRAFAYQKITPPSFFHLKTRVMAQWDSDDTNPKNIICTLNTTDATNSRFLLKLKDGTTGNYNSNFTFNFALKDSAAHTNITSQDLTTTIQDSTWHCVDVFISSGYGDGELAVWVDGILQIYFDTLNTRNAMPDSVFWGQTSFGTADVGSMVFDEIIIDEMACSPPCGLVFADGAKQIWSGMKNWFSRL